MTIQSFTQTAGIAWYGHHTFTDHCACCSQRRPVRQGFNGGAHIAKVCIPCSESNHIRCDVTITPVNAS